MSEKKELNLTQSNPDEKRTKKKTEEHVMIDDDDDKEEEEMDILQMIDSLGGDFFSTDGYDFTTHSWWMMKNSINVNECCF